MDVVQDTFLPQPRWPDEVPDIGEPRALLITIARGLLNEHWHWRSFVQTWLEALAVLQAKMLVSPRI